MPLHRATTQPALFWNRTVEAIALVATITVMTVHPTIRLAIAGALACLALTAPPLVSAADGPDPDKTEADDLERLLQNRPPVPATRGRGAGKAGAKAAALPADGSALNALVCQLAGPDGPGWHVVRFEPVEGKAALSPRRVLPCRLLERMEALARKKPATRFRIWGENAVYRDRLYILPLAVTVVRAADPALPADPARAAEPTPPADPKKTDPKKGGPASIDDVAAELLKGKPERAVVVPDKPGGPPDKLPDSVAPGTKTPVGPDRGEIVIDRLVRIEALAEKSRTWLAARFEADNVLSEPPLRLLPCRMLTLAEALARGGRKVRVTGRTTLYKGKRYLLLRKALRQRRLGRF